MATEKFTMLPAVSNATLSDIICAVQGGVSSQETLQQVFTLMSGQTIQAYAGNPNGNLAGTVYNLAWDSANDTLWVCTTSGTSSSAVWTQVATGVTGVVTPTQGGTGVSNPSAHTIPIAEGSSNFNFLGPLTTGQFLVGVTGNDPVPTSLVAGTNISITPSSGELTISSTGAAGIGWTGVSGTSQTMVADSGYVTLNSSLTTLTMPSTAAFGTLIYITGQGAGGWTIGYGSGQSINIGDTSSTVTSGSVSSTNRYDSLALICTIANTTWCALTGPQGNLTIV